VAGLAAADGGYFPPSWGWAGVGLASVAIAAGGLGGALRLGRLERGFLAALALVAAWAAVSATWSLSPPSSILEGQRLLVPLAAAGAFLLAGRRRSAAALSVGVLGAAIAVGTANLVLRSDRGAAVGGAAAEPVGYENGLAVLLVLGVAIAAGLVATAPTRGRRLLALAAGLFLLVPLAPLRSGGAWLALAAGLAAASVLRRARAPLAYPAAVGLGLAVAVAGAGALDDHRAAYWRVAAASIRDEPLHGTGAGTFARTWLLERRQAVQAHDAHNLYLETLAETGPLGLALLAGTLSIPLAAAVSARADPRAAPAGAAYAAFVVHAGIDWDWELAAVVVAAVAPACALLLLARPRAPSGALSPSGRVALIGAAAAVALAALVGLAGNTAVARAEAAVREGDWPAAEAQAARATRLAPWSAEAWRLRGEAQLGRGERAAARRSFRRALARDGSNPQLWLALANTLPRDERAAAVARALRLNPLGVAPE
jgi:tetratricopeptide (TPR) repeat protein